MKQKLIRNWLLSLVTVALFLAPTFNAHAASYSWNIYSNYIEYQPTGQDFYNKSCGQVNNSTQGYFRLSTTYSDQTIASYTVATNKTVKLDFGSCSSYGMTHILSRHVPEQFIGNPTTTQSFFNPGSSIGFYEDVIADIVNSNKTQIANNGFSSSGTVVYGYINGNTANKVKLVVKGGKIITMYPDGWGLGVKK
ncbi:hypothetical protein FZW96_03430 [Bacillus sp. BGMRC 2118]|nr:hypothetical protein FZW96_03430 [Bacillus sp. BGMRC 2118]